MYNKVILIGYLNHPITIKQINQNLTLGTITLTVERAYVKQGLPITEVSLIDCDLWGKQIEEANKFAPGSMIIVEGRIRSRRVPNLSTGKESVFISITVEKLSNMNEEEQQQVETSKVNIESNQFAQNVMDSQDELPF